VGYADAADNIEVDAEDGTVCLPLREDAIGLRRDDAEEK
jgi:hypothetical protein